MFIKSIVRVVMIQSHKVTSRKGAAILRPLEKDRSTALIRTFGYKGRVPEITLRLLLCLQKIRDCGGGEGSVLVCDTCMCR